MSPQERKKIYLEYLRMKLEEGDYHGVADCAMDLRELEVELRLIKMAGDETEICEEHKYLGQGPCPLCVDRNSL